ncbi:MAG: carbon-nitrogen hydrolase family protein [Gemmatimonadaceae bacterium]
MTVIRVALATLPFPASPAESVTLATAAIADAAAGGAAIVCFPECYVPGYRYPGRPAPQPDADFLDGAWTAVAEAAARHRIGVVLGTERLDRTGDTPVLRATVLVIHPDGTRAGFQDKTQVDPSEDGLYTPGDDRQLFEVAGLTFGVVICHEGFRYPETVRWAARRGAQVVFHPHVAEAEPGSYRPTTFADPANSFHEKAILCRAAENTCYVVSVNVASEGSPTTSAVASPDGTLLCFQPYGVAGVLVADLDLTRATRLLADRCRL